MEAGATDYLAKPVEIASLMEMIQKLAPQKKDLKITETEPVKKE